ncbi:MAG: carboxyltransferase domain-containing protein, partial [Pseudomonas sp.]
MISKKWRFASHPNIVYAREGDHLQAGRVYVIPAEDDLVFVSIDVLGFAPGFPYLGGLDARLATPRRAEPRPLVPAGAVGIAGAQTGIYSLPTPGGWQLIGRTPLRLFDPAADPPTLLRAGQHLRFVPI